MSQSKSIEKKDPDQEVINETAVSIEGQKRNNLITPIGYRKLIEELSELTKVERPRVVDEVHAAALQGDRSENAEYQYGKKRLREIDSRVRFLTRRVDTARIVDAREQKDHTIVLFGAAVTVKDQDGKTKLYRIVGEDEVDTANQKISWKSPIGLGLLKARLGDFVAIEVPVGTLEFEIVKIVYELV